MATKNPKSMSLEELKVYQDELKAKGKTEGNSKEAAKVASLIKVAQSKAGTKNYGSQELADAATLLSRGVTNPSGWTAQNADFIQSATGNAPDLTTGAPVGQLGVDPTITGAQTPTAGTTGDITSLEKQLADKQKALTEAMTNINDNPWYSEATRTGKLAKLNDVAQVDIQNLQSQINAKKAEQQQAFQNNITTQQLALQKQAASQPKTQLVTDANGNVSVIDVTTGKVINTVNGVATPQKKASGSGTSTTKTSKYLTSALSILKDEDVRNYGTADKQLSSWEADSAYNRILSLVGGDTAIADEVFKQAIQTGGYSSWSQ